MTPTAVQTNEITPIDVPPAYIVDSPDARIVGDEGNIEFVFLRVCESCYLTLRRCRCGEKKKESERLVYNRGVGLNQKIIDSLKRNEEAAQNAQVVSSVTALPSAETTQDMEGAKPSTHLATLYMRKLFLPEDRVFLQLIHSTETYIGKDGKPHAKTLEWPLSLEDACKVSTISRLAEYNRNGWNVYVCMNPIKAGALSRKKSDIVVVRTAYAEVDHNGEECRAAMRADVAAGIIPYPSIAVESSPHKYQFIWMVQGIDANTQEGINRALVAKYNTDPQSVDVARVLRLPGFRNMKAEYEVKPEIPIKFEASTEAHGAGVRYSAADFKLDLEIKESKTMGCAAPPEQIAKICDEIETFLINAILDPSGEETRGDWIYKFKFECPLPEHTKSHTREVSVKADGTIGSKCYGVKCTNCDWKWLREFLETTCEEKMSFPGPRDITFGEVSPASVPEVAPALISLVDTQPASEPEPQAPALIATPEPAGKDGKVSVADYLRSVPLLLTDRGLADMFNAVFGADYLFAMVTRKGEWMRWTGQVWTATSAGQMKENVKKISVEIRTNIIPGLENEISEDNRKRMEKLVKTMQRLASLCDSVPAVDRAFKFMEGMRERQFQEFDRQPMLFNFTNGTFDLQSQALRPFNREDLLTQMAAVAYHPDASCPTFETFLHKSFPSAPVREWLQRFLGYCLTGTGEEKAAPLLHGLGDNGKTILLEVVMSIFGHDGQRAYGKFCQWNTFAEAKNGGSAIRNDIAALHNARLVVCDEGKRNLILDDGIFKQATGSSTLTARFLNKEFFSFTPGFKLILATNNPPRIQGTDPATWARINDIPMLQRFPVGHPERIQSLKSLLLAERPGIAAWMVRGYQEFVLRGGLCQPEEIRVATEKYRQNSDVQAGFLSDCCEVETDYSEKMEVLWERYKAWASSVGLKIGGRHEFKEFLESHPGIRVRRWEHINGWPEYAEGIRQRAAVLQMPQNAASAVNLG